jgi:hypothetical protein
VRDNGTYRLPYEIRDRLARALTPYKNRDAAFTLAVFLARYWSVPGRVMSSFPIDRRALADHANLELTEAQVRGAARTLEAVAFLERAIPPCGSQYKATAEGLHRKPILYVFGSEYGPTFIAANKRARAARGSDLKAGRPLPPIIRPRPPATFLMARPLKSPKIKGEAKPQVIMGDLSHQPGLPSPTTTPSSLEIALKRLGEAIAANRNRKTRDK